MEYASIILDSNLYTEAVREMEEKRKEKMNFKENPREFLENIGDLNHPYDGWVACLEMIKAQKIDIKAFDTAAAAWLKEKVPILKEMAKDCPPEKFRELREVARKVMQIINVVTYRPFPFTKSCGVLLEKKDELLSITIFGDGGQWENGTKIILQEM